MGARRRYPDFDDLSAEEFAELLRIAKLSSAEKEIATQSIVWRMADADIAAMVYVDRRTVARWLDNWIVPELRRMREKLKKAI